MVDVSIVQAQVFDQAEAIALVAGAVLAVFIGIAAIKWTLSALGHPTEGQYAAHAAANQASGGDAELDAMFAQWEQSEEAVALRAEVGDDLSKLHWTEAQWRGYISEPETTGVSVSPAANWARALAAMSPEERAEYEQEDARQAAEDAAFYAERGITAEEANALKEIRKDDQSQFMSDEQRKAMFARMAEAEAAQAEQFGRG